jgi:hypothetical protein
MRLVGKSLQSGRISRNRHSARAICFRRLSVLIGLVVIAVVVFVPPTSDITDDADFLAMALPTNPAPDDLTSVAREPSQDLLQSIRAPFSFLFHDQPGNVHNHDHSILTSCRSLRC